MAVGPGEFDCAGGRRLLRCPRKQSCGGSVQWHFVKRVARKSGRRRFARSVERARERRQLQRRCPRALRRPPGKEYKKKAPGSCVPRGLGRRESEFFISITRTCGNVNGRQ